MKLPAPNIHSRGRWIRAAGGALFLLAAFAVRPHSGVLALVFAGSGLFMLFEAARGWCAFRACGIKTPL